MTDDQLNTLADQCSATSEMVCEICGASVALVIAVVDNNLILGTPKKAHPQQVAELLHATLACVRVGIERDKEAQK